MSRSLFLTSRTCLIALVAVLLVSSFLSETVIGFECNQYECPPGYDYCACRGFTCSCSRYPQQQANMIEKKIPVRERNCGSEVCGENCYCNGYEFKCVCPFEKADTYENVAENELFDAIYDEEE